jgi:hypothetical protein
MKNLLILLFILSFFSCDIQKKAIKTKTDRTVNELTERTIKRKGDTVTYIIPNIKLKDTTIYTINRQGTTLKTVYDNKGQLSQIDCFSSLIEITERTERMMQEFIKDKNSEKTENFDSSFILYIMLGIVLMFLILVIFGFKYLNQNTKAVSEILNKLP